MDKPYRDFFPRDTQPRTLSGVPRVEGVAPETPAQDVRNALAILHAAAIGWIGPRFDFDRVAYDRADFNAIIARLNTAVTKLERNG